MFIYNKHNNEHKSFGGISTEKGLVHVLLSKSMSAETVKTVISPVKYCFTNSKYSV